MTVHTQQIKKGGRLLKSSLKEKMELPFVVKSARAKTILTIFMIVVMLTFAVRGLTKPWAYGYFNYTLNWFHGFIPRGFVGTIGRLLFGNLYYSQTFLSLLQYALAWLFIFYLCYMVYQLIYANGNLIAALVMFVFFTSTFCMFYLSEIGFFDHILYLLVAIYIEISLRQKVKTCLIFGGILSALCPLILDTGAFVACPIIASIAAIRVISERSKIVLHDCRNICFVFIPTIIMIAIYKLLQPNLQAVEIFLKQSQARSYYSTDFDYYGAFFKMKNLGNTTPHSWVYIPPQVVIYGALLIGLTTLFLYIIRANTTVILTYAVCAFASGFVGYAAIYFGSDYHRYYFATVMSIFIISLYVLRTYASSFVKWKHGVVAIIITVFIITNIMGYRLWHWNQVYWNFWFKILFKSK